MDVVIRIYRFFFARNFFYSFNKLIYRLSLSGLGVFNCENEKVSGELNFMKKYFDKNRGGVVLDVGANIGKYAQMVLKYNPTVLIYAFEPHPKNYKILIDNINNENFFAINAAVGEDKGALSLFDYEDKDGSSHASLYKDVIENIHNSRSVEHKVEVLCLDDFTELNNIKDIKLLKIDTEGNELNVLKGAKKLIDSDRIAAIQFEFNVTNVSSRTFFRDFWNLLHNYNIYRLLPNDMVRIKKYNQLYCEIFAFQNIVAILKKNEI